MVQQWTVRRPSEDEAGGAFGLLEHAFGEARDPQEHELDRRLLPPERLLVALDGDEVVGVTGAFDFALAVPGTELPASGVTIVGVVPTHRRRGVATALLRTQLTQVRQPLAALFASETGIYGRYGYGLAASALRVSVDTRLLRQLPPPTGRVRLVEPQAARSDLEVAYEAARRQRPGAVRHAAEIWDMRLFDSEVSRSGRTPLRCAVHDGPAGADGYALYRTRAGWDEDLPDGRAWVTEFVAATPNAAVDLWSYLLGLDLVTAVNATVPVDDPLLALLPERRAARPRLTDNLWVRLVDLPSALAARAYSAPCDLVLAVRDDVLPANNGRWRLVATPSGARCEASDAAPDVGLDVADLGAAYLGGTSLLTLRDAGRLDGAAEAVERLARALWWPRAPFCAVSF